MQENERIGSLEQFCRVLNWWMTIPFAFCSIRMVGKSISRDCPIYSCIHSNNQELLCLELNLEVFFFFTIQP